MKTNGEKHATSHRERGKTCDSCQTQENMPQAAPSAAQRGKSQLSTCKSRFVTIDSHFNRNPIPIIGLIGVIFFIMLMRT